MQAVNDRLLIRKGTIPERTVGGIFITAGTASDAKSKLNIGKVISHGNVPVSNGEYITWEQFGDLQAEVLGRDMVCVRWEDVIAVLDEDDVKGWIFDPAEYDKIHAKQQEELEVKRKELLEAQNKSNEGVRYYVCGNRSCFRAVGKNVRKKPGDNLTCEYCGKELDEAKGQVAPLGIVKDGTPYFGKK